MRDLETRMHDLGGFIREQRRIARLSLRKLSDMAGISNPYLSQIERGLRKPSAEILQQIARALRISAETLYIRAGILDERESESSLVDAILRDSSITEAQKQSLIAVYQAFRHENEGAPAPSELRALVTEPGDLGDEQARSGDRAVGADVAVDWNQEPGGDRGGPGEEPGALGEGEVPGGATGVAAGESGAEDGLQGERLDGGHEQAGEAIRPSA